MKLLISLFVIALAFTTVACKAQVTDPNKTDLSVQEFDKMSRETPDAVIVDVRSPIEYVEGYIPNAVNIDYTGKYWLQVVNTLDSTKTYFLYCLGGSRSADAATYMRSQGINKIYTLQPGLEGWQKENMPIATHNVNLRERANEGKQ